MPEVSEQRDTDELIAQAASTMEVLARALHVRDAQLQPTLDAIVSAAASALNAGRDAGLILLERGKLIPRAVTGGAPLYLDLHQQQTGEGPCIEAARQQSVIRIRPEEILRLMTAPAAHLTCPDRAQPGFPPRMSGCRHTSGRRKLQL